MTQIHNNTNTNENNKSRGLLLQETVNMRSVQEQRKRTTYWFPKDYKQALDAIQRLVCIGLAAWVLVRGNLWEGIVILTAGHIDPRRAKEILAKLLKTKT